MSIQYNSFLRICPSSAGFMQWFGLSSTSNSVQYSTRQHLRPLCFHSLSSNITVVVKYHLYAYDTQLNYFFNIDNVKEAVFNINTHLQSLAGTSLKYGLHINSKT